mgnify:CR=1 FL=1
MTLDERVKEAQLSIYIPENQAAICADCRGVFLYVNGQCPGCGSRQWVLLVPPPIAASLNKEER